MLAEHSSASGQWTGYLRLGGTPVGLMKGNTLHWVHPDHLGRPEVVTNTAAQRVWRAANLAFERNVLLDQVGGYNLGFPGQYWNAESGVWQNGFRDYEATLGRYLQSDPIGLSGGVSTYAYVGGGPASRTDPLGLIDMRGQQIGPAYSNTYTSVSGQSKCPPGTEVGSGLAGGTPTDTHRYMESGAAVGAIGGFVVGAVIVGVALLGTPETGGASLGLLGLLFTAGEPAATAAVVGGGTSAMYGAIAGGATGAAADHAASNASSSSDPKCGCK